MKRQTTDQVKILPKDVSDKNLYKLHKEPLHLNNEKTNNIKKQAKCFYRHVTKVDIYMINKHRKRCSR